MIYIGLICLIYYICICAVMGKWNSTFSRFWLIAGIVFILLSRFVNLLICLILLPIGVFFIYIEVKILIQMNKKAEENLPYIIVLGAKVNGTEVSESLRRRLDCAVTYLKHNPGTKVIVSGSKLGGELITEAEAMKHYLLEYGISEERVVKEENSYTTQQNLKFSKKLIPDDNVKVGIITSNYHVYRALCYAKHLGYKEPIGIAASTHPVLFLNYMVREFFAILKLFWLTKKMTML